MNLNDHKKVRALLESEHALDNETAVALQAHLYNCAECRAYAEMITQLEAGSWNPFPHQRLTQTESKKVMGQIRLHLKKASLVQNTGFFKLSSALGLIGLLIIFGLFALAIAQLNQTAVSPAAPLAESDSTLSDYIWYDGWETGIAFQFPASWTINQINAADSSIITFTTPRNEIGDWFSCEPLAASGASANPAAWFVPFDENMPMSPLEFLTFFLESGEISSLEPPQTVTLDGRSAAYTLGEIPCEEPANQITVMSAETDTHHVLLVLRHAPAEATTTRTELETVVTSLTNVDYAGWQPWRPGQFNYTIMAPTGWNVFDASKSLEVTPNNQPAWSSIADPNQPANAPRIYIFHNLNSQFGDTPQEVVERHISQMETDLAMQQVDPPTAHPLVPGMVTAVYTTEDTAIFFGAITYPRDTFSLDPIGATATVPLDQLDSFRPTFERILRSLNGYYDGITDAPVRAALTGSGTAVPPTASPIAQTTATAADGESPTPTPTALPTDTPTPTPFDATPTP